MMANMINLCWSLLLLSVGLVLGERQQSNQDAAIPKVWENVKFDRFVDLSRVYTRERMEVVVKNIGSEPAQEYFLAYPSELLNKISLISGTFSTEGKEDFVNITFSEYSHEVNEKLKVSYLRIVLDTPLAPGSEVTFKTAIEYNLGGVPYPEKIELHDEQRLLFSTFRLPFSPYETKESILKFVGSTEYNELNAPAATELQGNTAIEENTIVYGPFKDIHPLTVENPVSIVYLHNLPLNNVNNLKREIWVSHWASTIQFEEYYELTNRAAKLTKGFSRIEHMRQQRKTLYGHYRAIIDNILPSNAFDHYYTDLVGMVSTFQIKDQHYYLKPRYPIYGGWNYNYTIGWTNQLSDFLKVAKTGSYILSVPLLNGPLDTAYENTEVSIYLPEGSVVEDVAAPILYKNVTVSTKHSYFDLNQGHVKVTFEFENMNDNLSAGQLLVKYKYDNRSFFKKPSTIAYYIFVALMSLFLLNCLNLNTDK